MAERLNEPYDLVVVGDDSILKYTLMKTLTGDEGELPMKTKLNSDEIA